MSLSARAAVSAMRFAKRLGLFPTPGDLGSEIAKARAFNQKHPYREPSDHKARYSTEYIGGYPVLIMKPLGVAPKKAILFLHGGGDKDAWRPAVAFARTYGKRTGADVFYPLYPPFTEAPVGKTADWIYEVYAKLAKDYGAKNIAVVGGSYGGFLAMQLITWINRNGNAVDMPALLIMNSPFALPETAEEWALARQYERIDPMVPEGSMRLMLDGILNSDPETPDYALYPGKMDFRRAPETWVFYTEETCACVSGAIQNAYARDGAANQLHMHTEPGMMHCYACAPVFPESKRDFNRQIELIRKL